MKIQEYLEKHNIRPADFIKKIDVSLSYFNCLLQERSFPGKHLIRVIEFETGGLVSRSDWIRKPNYFK
jgi:hypothetical protein